MHYLNDTRGHITRTISHELKSILYHDMNFDEHYIDTLRYNDIIAKARTTFFDFDYPTETETFKFDIETLFLKRYYDRPIGSDVMEQFKLWLDDRLNSIMPYYNQLYLTTLLDFDPLLSYKHDEIINLTRDINELIKQNEEAVKDNVQDTVTDTTGKNITDSTGNSQTTNHSEDETNTVGNSKNTTDNVTDNQTDGTSTTNGSGTSNTDDWLQPQTGGNSLTNDYRTKISKNTTTDTSTTDTHSTGKTNSVTNSNTDSTTNTKGSSDSNSNTDTTSNVTSDTTNNLVSKMTALEEAIRDLQRTLSSNTKQETIRKAQGYTQSASLLLKEYRSTILNLVNDIVNACEDLFLFIY